MDIKEHIHSVNAAHEALQAEIAALVKEAGGDRRIVYQTTLSDGGEVKLTDEVSDLFDEARLFPNRWKLSEWCASELKEEVGMLPKIVEVGVETGVYSSFLADLFQPDEMLLLDTKFIHFQDPHQRACMIRLEGFSSSTIPKLEDQSIAYAYIDAAHTFKNVSEDIENILPKMRRGGIIQFNDYATFNLRFAEPYGVKAAVNNLINSRRVSVVGHGLCPLGFDDIAVKVH